MNENVNRKIWSCLVTSPNAHASTVQALCNIMTHCLYEKEVVLNFADLQIFSYQKQDKAI